MFSFFKSKDPEKKILLYGLQRSGTNYLQSLIEINYPQCEFLNTETRNEITHKHFRLYDDKNKIPEPKFQNTLAFNSFNDFEKQLQEYIPDLYIIISKDPYSWFVSYNNWSKKNNWQKPNYNYTEEYNLFYSKWMEFAKQTNKIIFIRYVDLLEDTLSVINKIAESLNLPAKQKIKTTKKVYASRKFTGSRKEDFLNNEHLKKISTEELITINKFIDKTLLQFLNYEIVNQ